MALIRIAGILVPGHRVASQASREYPYGTIWKQTPYFRALGLDLAPYFSGTLNVSIAPLTWKIVAPEFTFRQVAWTDLHPPEDFSFSRCAIRFEGKTYAGLVYYPHPETKKRHFQNASLVEVLAEWIPGIHYGDTVELELRGEEIRVDPPTGG
jgi:hypothetical protein